MSASLNRENLTLVLALSRSYQEFLRAITPLFKQVGLTPSQWDVLEILYSKGTVSVNDLIRLALSSSGNLDVVIKNLLDAGLVTKTVAKHDRRSRMISLTARGKRKVKSFYPTHNRALEDIFQHLSTREKQQLIKKLNQLRKRIKQNHTENRA